MYQKIKELIPIRLKNKLIDTILNNRYNKILSELKNIDENKPVIYILGAPEHGNLGDHAILDAELKFLKKYFSENVVVEIPFKMVNYKHRDLQNIIKPEDIVCVTGGGYMGSLWPHNEEFIRGIISNYSNNKIIVFPQTAYYQSNKSSDLKYLEESMQFYDSHKDLTLTAREEKSYNLFNNYYKNSKNLLTPDIGLFLNETENSVFRKDILVCLRSDREKILKTNDIMKKIEKYADKYNMSISKTDTVLNRPVTKKSRGRLLQKKLNEFRKSKIVVTDRLHGMVFAAITSTPCIALDNKTGKVKGVHAWIEDQGYISLLDDIEDFDKEFERLITLKNVEYDVSSIREEYLSLIKSFELR